MEGLKKIAGVHRSLKQVDKMKLQQEVIEALRMVAVVSVSDGVQALSDQVEDHTARKTLSAVIMPGGWKTDPEGAVVTYLLFVLEAQAFRNEVRDQVRWEGASKDPDGMVRTIGRVKEIYIQHEAVGAANIAVAGRNQGYREDKLPANKGGGQHASPSAPVNARGTFGAPVDGSSYCDGTHRQVSCPQLKRSGNGDRGGAKRNGRQQQAEPSRQRRKRRPLQLTWRILMQHRIQLRHRSMTAKPARKGPT